MAGLLKPSLIPPREQRELSGLTRYRRKLIQMVPANKNRIIRTLEDGNVKLSSVLSDTSSKTGTTLIDMLCDGKELTLQDIEQVRHSRCHHTAEEMQEACTDYMNEHKRYMLLRIKEYNRKLTAEVAELDRRIKEIVAPCGEVMVRLSEIPGLQNRTLEDLIAEIGLDMPVYPSAESLCKWATMCPVVQRERRQE